jgi:hypothetical protein
MTSQLNNSTGDVAQRLVREEGGVGRDNHLQRRSMHGIFGYWKKERMLPSASWVRVAEWGVTITCSNAACMSCGVFTVAKRGRM